MRTHRGTVKNRARIRRKRRVDSRRCILSGISVVAALLLVGPTLSQARPASRGPYAEIGLGAAGFLGDKAVYAAAGPAVDLRAGYDLFPWMSLGVKLGGSTHEATVPPPPEGEYFQLYGLAAEIRFQVRQGRIGFFLDGELGTTAISSNVLAKVEVLGPGEDRTLSFGVGGGLEYQLLNRHHAFGLAGQWTRLVDFGTLSNIGGRFYLRYTY